ncbi:hypothetical protein G4D82_10705 [Flavobacterium sp. CYK-4]|uniref:hypothetical protein n=1 Tax=Flavobacterium lotistagni TaxID=2709660 RepID=UPI0014094B06|nr:hypothetical protein [Flavobacterium lotistagni]NHM07693.1 hypothetical protein [Flavobacterium lotistagni]
MRESQIFILFLIGLILILFGSVFKFMDWPLASLLLIVGMTFQGATVLILVYKLIKKKFQP